MIMRDIQELVKYARTRIAELRSYEECKEDSFASHEDLYEGGRLEGELNELLYILQLLGVSPDSGLNTRIDYFVRDADNYKSHQSAVVKGTISEEQKTVIYESLYEGESFLPELLGLPDTRNWDYDEDVDQPWWELVGFCWTEEKPTTNMTAEDLVKAFEDAAESKWGGMANV